MVLEAGNQDPGYRLPAVRKWTVPMKTFISQNKQSEETITFFHIFHKKIENPAGFLSVSKNTYMWVFPTSDVV